MAKKYLDEQGTQYLINKLKAELPTTPSITEIKPLTIKATASDGTVVDDITFDGASAKSLEMTAITESEIQEIVEENLGSIQSSGVNKGYDINEYGGLYLNATHVFTANSDSKVAAFALDEDKESVATGAFTHSLNNNQVLYIDGYRTLEGDKGLKTKVYVCIIEVGINDTIAIVTNSTVVYCIFVNKDTKEYLGVISPSSKLYNSNIPINETNRNQYKYYPFYYISTGGGYFIEKVDYSGESEIDTKVSSSGQSPLANYEGKLIYTISKTTRVAIHVTPDGVEEYKEGLNGEKYIKFDFIT